MKIGIIIYAFMLSGSLSRLLRRIVIESSAEVYLFLHSRQPDVVQQCELFAELGRVHYYPYGVNRGLAKSFNEGLLDGYFRDGMDVMMTSNDDLLPASGDIERIAAAAMANRDKYYVNGRCNTGGRDEDSDLSLAAINPIALDTIGYSDENFFPAYFEDVDWRRRARLVGLEFMTVPDTNIVHVGSGSLPHVSREQHDIQFLANQAYYERKWGGLPGKETFVRPFNQFDLKIPADKRHAPYPGYDRIKGAV